LGGHFHDRQVVWRLTEERRVHFPLTYIQRIVTLPGHLAAAHFVCASRSVGYWFGTTPSSGFAGLARRGKISEPGTMKALDRIRGQHLALGLGLGLGALHCAGTRDANAPGMAKSSTYPTGRFIVASRLDLL
jgi:hypothetical protein